jgi:hypothetical protein
VVIVIRGKAVVVRGKRGLLLEWWVREWGGGGGGQSSSSPGGGCHQVKKAGWWWCRGVMVVGEQMCGGVRSVDIEKRYIKKPYFFLCHFFV